MISQPHTGYSVLSPRQQECIEYLLQGKTAKETAKIMKLSNRTVEFYLSNIRSKLNCKNKAELIFVATRLYHQ